MSSTKKAVITALCVSLCAVLPLAFHALGLGAAFSPMHIPVLLCGLVCGPVYGAFCGIAGPVISSLTTSMPGAVQLIYFVPELMAYGLLSGLFYAKLRTGRMLFDIILSLIPAMLLGRVVGGAAQALFCLFTVREYSLALWAAGYLVGSAPGIIMHLLLIPVLIITLSKAKLIPGRYVK